MIPDDTREVCGATCGHPMSLRDARRVLYLAGCEGVMSRGGPLKLSDWRPYSFDDASADAAGYRVTIDLAALRVRDVARDGARSPLLGVWTILPCVQVTP